MVLACERLTFVIIVARRNSLIEQKEMKEHEVCLSKHDYCTHEGTTCSAEQAQRSSSHTFTCPLCNCFSKQRSDFPFPYLDNRVHDVCCIGSRLDGINAAADHLSHAIALEPRFWPALVEKARLWAAVGDWEQVRTST